MHSKSSGQTIPRRPAWYKANDDELDAYTCKLNEKLAFLQPPQELSCHDPHCNIPEHLQARDSFLLDILISMIETSHETIPMGGGKKTKLDPDRNCEVETALPGWIRSLNP